MSLIRSIIIANRLKNKYLDVKKHGSFLSWDWKEDEGWVEYTNTLWIISRHKIIYYILNKLRLI